MVAAVSNDRSASTSVETRPGTILVSSAPKLTARPIGHRMGRGGAFASPDDRLLDQMRISGQLRGFENQRRIGRRIGRLKVRIASMSPVSETTVLIEASCSSLDAMIHSPVARGESAAPCEARPP